MADGEDATGAWRKGQHVLWSDVLVPLQAMLVWLGLFTIAVAIAFASGGKQRLSTVNALVSQMGQPVGSQLIAATLYLTLLFSLWRIARRVADESLIARFRPVRSRAILLPALAAASLIALSELASHALVKFQPNPHEKLFMPGSFLQYPVVLITVGLIAPFVEEFYFRGVMLSWLSRKITLVPAVVVTAALFGLVHLRFVSQPGTGGWVLTAIVAAFGLASATLAVQTRSLWPSVALHSAYNSTLLGLALWAMFAK